MHAPFKSKLVVFLIGSVIFLEGCATGEYRPIRAAKSKRSYIRVKKKGVYHKVKSGETMWRIAKLYDVPISEIVSANNMPSAAHIEKGQLVFIPDAKKQKNFFVDENTSNPNEFSWPLKGKVISYFGQSTENGINRGVNIRVKSGDTVYASRAGRVVFADRLSGYSNTVIIDHRDGYFTIYSQNSFLLVSVGDFIEKGMPIAQVGNHGKLAFLHFEIRKKDIADNPLYYLP